MLGYSSPYRVRFEHGVHVMMLPPHKRSCSFVMTVFFTDRLSVLWFVSALNVACLLVAVCVRLGHIAFGAEDIDLETNVTRNIKIKVLPSPPSFYYYYYFFCRMMKDYCTLFIIYINSCFYVHRSTIKQYSTISSAAVFLPVLCRVFL